jgi:ligand-binding sensor domain-containing protein/serine phosphatase RsbU (regulator of sigma subunit)
MTRLTALTLKRVFPLLLCCVGAFGHAPAALALDPRLALNQYLLDVWTTEHGLPQNSVRAILQTRDGYLWLGTAEGLVRFDGVRFTVFNKANTAEIKDHSIFSLCEDGEGNLWVGTEYGYLMQFRDGKFTSRQLAQHGIFPLYRDRAGNLWMGVGTDGLARFRDGKLTTWKTSEGLSHNSVRAIYEDKAGRLWIGTNVGLDEFRGGKFIHYTAQHGLSPGRVNAIVEDQQGTLWLGTQVGDADQGGLTELRDGRFKVWTAREGLSYNGIYRLFVDRAGTLWVGTNGGLNRFRDGKFGALTTKENLPDDIILSLYEDREGSLWVGMLSGGLARLRDRRFLTYTRADGLSSDDVMGVQADRTGGVWAAATNGLSYIKDGKITRYTTADGLPDNYVNDIFVDGEDNLWVATEAGVSRFRQGRFQTWTTRDGLSSNAVRSFSQDQAGNLWIGTDRGLDRFRDGRVTQYLKNEEVPNFLWTHLLAGRGGALWAGDGYGGLALVRDGKLTNYPRQEGFPNPVSRLYEEQDGCLWIGTSGNGLFRLKDGRFTRYTVREGLFDNSAWAILEDGQGNFWMSCNRGVYRVSRQELHDFADGKISAVHSVAYDTADGLKSREFSTGGARTGDGRLWFSTVKGVAVIDPASLRDNAVPPPVVVEGVTVDGVTYPGNVAAAFAPGRQSFEFQYTGLSLLVPQKVRFKYKLEGYDRDWVDAGTRRTAYYTNLPPGDYKFRVIAANNDGVWNEAGAAFDFYHRPYFWQTWWFYALCALALAGAVFGGVRLRVRQMKLREERLVALVKERTRNLVKAKEDTEAALKEVERQKAVIEADNERKTRELEEARALQLSLLPKQLPRLPHLEVAAWMRPATEVGGDYYDFHLNGDGSLVAAVGDATGHGLKAGTMVTATKLLFETLADEQDLRAILRQANESLRKMKLRGLYMAFALARVSGRGLTVCGAGMPPLLIYRAAAGRVESVPLRGMPLGSLSKYNYAQQEFTLAPGDVLLLMTDGFAERFNREGEMLGEEKAGEVLAATAARLSAQEIIARLVSVGDEWAGERQQDDDVTFVVMKLAPQPPSNGLA